jgi:putative ABC transport system permease protein
LIPPFDAAPPRFARWLLTVTAVPRSREAQLGDLEEEFHDRAQHDLTGARRWYWGQAIGSVGPNLLWSMKSLTRSTKTGNRGDGMMKTLLHDLRLALRAARTNLAFSAVVVLTLGLGIGANSTIFSAVYGLVINPFPFPEPDRIVGVGTAYPKLNVDLGFVENLSPLEYVDIRDQSRTLEHVVAWDMGNRQIAGDGPPQNVFTGFWWGDALRTLGMDAHLGRGFSDQEIERGDAVALLSYRSWRDRFGADSSMVGQTLVVNGNPHTLIGIIPEGVNIYGMDLWTVLGAKPDMWPRNRRQFQIMAHVRDGFSLQEVNTELEGLARRTEQVHAAEFEEYEGWRAEARTWNDVSSQLFRAGLWLVLGAVGFVLLLICANTANLLLARAQGRRREMAVRTALGAGKSRLMSQLLTESIVLAGLGGTVGVGVAFLGARQVLTFTAAIALGVGVLFGLFPALQASRTDISGALQSEGKGSTTGRSRQRIQRSLVGVEVALAFVLLAGGGLLVNSFLRMSLVDPGFDHENVLTMRLTLPREEYEGDAVPAFFQDLLERLGAVPGVRAAGAGTQFPPIAFSYRELWFEGTDADPEATLPTALATVVAPGYFESLGIPLRSGRIFDDRDGAGSPMAVVVNEAIVQRYFGGENPVGSRLKVGGPNDETPWFDIVGVVGTTRNRGLDQDPYPEVFALHAQLGGDQNQLYLTLRTEVEAQSVLPAVRRTVAEMDPDQPIYAIQTIEEAFASASSSRRVVTLLLTLFGVFALVLAAVGIYSVVSFTVGERTQEIGLRVALGADAGRVRGLVVRQALLPVLVGAVVGTGLAIPLGMALEDMLFEVGSVDPLTIASVATVLVVTAMAASWMPAWRASRMDPVEALRKE